MSRLYDEYGSGSSRIGEGTIHLSWSDLFTDAINFANNGFPMYQSMYDRLILNKNRMMLFESTRKLFFSYGLNKDQPPQVGEIFKNKDIADTLTLIANKGKTIY